LSLLAAPVAAQGADSLPEGVTPEMVAKGKKIFGGAGLCMACHGPAGKGMTGPDLTDATWLHFDGSYQAIVKIVTGGIDDKQSKTGIIMPPKGGSSISEEDVRAVAAYVWALSKRP
jgi:mono/diheme cytochrome c family protein